jgi:N-acetylglucosamine malate deacetylase 1
MKIDILAIGAHPDDVEIGCGGTLAKHVALGCKVGIIDLTKGELGSRGNATLRETEATDAATILGASFRKNLGFRDGFFINDEQHQIALISLIRKYQPEIVLTNAVNDRHPDHAKSAQLTIDSCFLAGLKKIETYYDNHIQEEWRPKTVYHYIQAYHIKPDFTVDISDYYETKINAIKAHATQFYNPALQEKDTFISSPKFLELIHARAIEFGIQAGFHYGEGFSANRYLGVQDLRHLF